MQTRWVLDWLQCGNHALKTLFSPVACQPTPTIGRTASQFSKVQQQLSISQENYLNLKEKRQAPASSPSIYKLQIGSNSRGHLQVSEKAVYGVMMFSIRFKNPR